MDMINDFIDFENNQTKTNRGGIVMYDVKGHYKYLSLAELFDYWKSRITKTKNV